MNTTKTLFSTLTILATVVCFSTPAMSAMLAPTTGDFLFTDTNNPGNKIAPNRLPFNHIIDGDSSTFRSLGLGGKGVFSFGTAFTGDVKIWETTYSSGASGVCGTSGAGGTCDRYPESISVYGGNIWSGNFADLDPLNTTDWTKIGDLGNYDAQAAQGGGLLNTTGTFQYLLLVDTSQIGPSEDGFDISQVSVSAVPIPAAGWLFFSALAGVVAIGRRRAA